jgi:hypothetical protein
MIHINSFTFIALIINRWNNKLLKIRIQFVVNNSTQTGPLKESWVFGSVSTQGGDNRTPGKSYPFPGVRH